MVIQIRHITPRVEFFYFTWREPSKVLYSDITKYGIATLSQQIVVKQLDKEEKKTN